MTVSSRTPRPIDHLVLPVSELGVARERLTQLGFTVAKDARHPFGTENCCVFLSDGSYLEPLGIANREECEEAARKGNVFVARDQAYRFRRGLEGFSGIAMASGDAWDDDQRYTNAGISGGEVLEFSRDMLLPDGDRQFPPGLRRRSAQPGFFLLRLPAHPAATLRPKVAGSA
jgi:hypothetical protein